ncbi:hypothetical protein BOTNAR_0091g00130 [Botryotinia narcissicola]|uniref:Uncharacterized protein n=1 Tax=Botryotinia narcissicola TaxID=278944 RepID=A0A4Z1IRI8_9HELO|nr:hypothetical protein BOTNAR_0091g00130 [Botryotinia narcissicola]
MMRDSILTLQLLGAFPPQRMQKSRGRRNARIGTDVYMPGHIIHFSLTPRPTLRIRRAAASGRTQVLGFIEAWKAEPFLRAGLI